MTQITLIPYQIDLTDGQKLKVFAPEGDETIYGTISVCQHDLFHFRDVSFTPGDVVLDIGCNVGLFSLLVARVHPGVRVLSFDPSPLAIQCLYMATVENHLFNVQPFQVGVGDKSKRGVAFCSNGKDRSCLVAEGLPATGSAQETITNMVSIDELFDSPLLGIDRVKYLKMDIEGGEFPIFEHLFAARPDILARIDYLHLETHGNPEENAALRARVKTRFGARAFFDV